MHTRHDNIVLQILTVVLIDRAAKVHGFELGVVVPAVRAEQGRIEPKSSGCAEVCEARGASEVFTCIYTHGG